jgi:hypothetical protein
MEEATALLGSKAQSATIENKSTKSCAKQFALKYEVS